MALKNSNLTGQFCHNFTQEDLQHWLHFTSNILPDRVFGFLALLILLMLDT